MCAVLVHREGTCFEVCVVCVSVHFTAKDVCSFAATASARCVSVHQLVIDIIIKLIVLVWKTF